MALLLKDRVQETCNSPGTGTVTLLGAQTGYQAFSAAVGNGNTTYYAIADQTGANWEVGLGTYSSTGNTLARTTVLASSNAGSLTNFSSGIQNVWVDYPAGKAIYTDASGNVSNLAGGISTASYLTFNTAPTVTPTAGMAYWNSTQQGLELQMDANVGGTINQDQFFYVKASVAITKGQVCMFTGAVGASGVLTAAPATGVTDGLIIMGIAAESIALNGFGFIQSTGTLSGLNTNSFTQGAILYFDPTVTGGLTATKPAMTGPQVVVAAVMNVGPANGSVFVRVTYIPEISDIPGMGTGVQAALQVAVGSAGAPVLFNGALGTPTSGTLTNCTGLPISSGVSGLGTGVATWLGTPNSANLAAAMTDETGSGSLVFATSPTLVTPLLGTPTSGTLTNCTGLPISSGVSGLATGAATFLATPTSANLAALLTDETGSGASVFATSPTLVTPILGTPQSGNFSTGTFTWPTFNQNTTGQAGSVANAHTAGSGLSGSTFNGSAAITWTLATAYGDTINPYASKTANYVLAAPNGAAGVPTFRAIVAADIPTLNQNTTGSAGSVTNAVTFNNGGAGAASGTTYNGSAAQTISYNTVGAPSTTGTNASGTWAISISGTAATANSVASNVVTRAMIYKASNDATALLCGTDGVILINPKTITTNTTIPASVGASSTGPITINTGVTVTISSGSKWVIL